VTTTSGRESKGKQKTRRLPLEFGGNSYAALMKLAHFYGLSGPNAEIETIRRSLQIAQKQAEEVEHQGGEVIIRYSDGREELTIEMRTTAGSENTGDAAESPA
jgi:hypothetical protein